VEVDALSTLGTIAPVATFTYDALGRRVSKTTYSTRPPLAPVTTQYVYDVVEYKDGEDGTMHTRPKGSNAILEDRSGSTVNRIYCWAGECRTAGGGGGTPDVVVGFTATGSAQYYHGDELGNTLALTDASGNMLERYAYDDYGQPQFFAANGSQIVGSDGQPVAASSLGNPFLFHGMEWDGESGLYFDGAQSNPLYEDPKTGSYITVPWVPSNPSIPRGSSRTFAGNNPWSGGGGRAMVQETVVFRPARGEIK
jgi:hypothetical protein